MLGGGVRFCPKRSSTPAAIASEPSAVVLRTSRRVCGMAGSLLQGLLDDRLVDVAPLDARVTDRDANRHESVMLIRSQRDRIVRADEREDLLAAFRGQGCERRPEQTRRDAL